MPKSLTKVMNRSQAFSQKKSGGVGWDAVLTDIQADIAYLKQLIPIVERKIKRGEPWPGQSGDSATQN